MFKKEAKTLPNLDEFVLRVFFRGKELKDEHYLAEFQLENKDMVQVFFQSKK